MTVKHLKCYSLSFFVPCRGHLYHRDVCHDGLLEEQQLRGHYVLQRDVLFLHMCGEGSGTSLEKSFSGF